VLIRDFGPGDAPAVNSIALAAFAQYRDDYADWNAFSKIIGAMATLAASGELIVATLDGRVGGAVVYFGPTAPKATFFDPTWAVMRMLVVDPALRGLGLGRALTAECIGRAERQACDVIALHTSPIMKVALAMYLRSGFALQRAAPPIYGVPYGVYVKRLGPAAGPTDSPRP
jgi:ribosomal protein S18 acetylase RimI-like enzyme